MSFIESMSSATDSSEDWRKQQLVWILIGVLSVAFVLLFIIVIIYCKCMKVVIPKEPIDTINRLKTKSVDNRDSDRNAPKVLSSSEEKKSKMSTKVSEMHTIVMSSPSTNTSVRSEGPNQRKDGKTEHYSQLEEPISETERQENMKILSQTKPTKPDSKYESKTETVSQIGVKESTQPQTVSQVEDQVRQLLSKDTKDTKAKESELDDRVRQLLSKAPNDKKSQISSPKSSKLSDRVLELLKD